jgi:hypothetical protein
MLMMINRRRKSNNKSAYDEHPEESIISKIESRFSLSMWERFAISSLTLKGQNVLGGCRTWDPNNLYAR